MNAVFTCIFIFLQDQFHLFCLCSFLCFICCSIFGSSCFCQWPRECRIRTAIVVWTVSYFGRLWIRDCSLACSCFRFWDWLRSAIWAWWLACTYSCRNLYSSLSYFWRAPKPKGTQFWSCTRQTLPCPAEQTVKPAIPCRKSPPL